jgi:hypothetical protein
MQDFLHSSIVHALFGFVQRAAAFFAKSKKVWRELQKKKGERGKTLERKVEMVFR